MIVFTVFVTLVHVSPEVLKMPLWEMFWVSDGHHCKVVIPIFPFAGIVFDGVIETLRVDTVFTMVELLALIEHAE